MGAGSSDPFFAFIHFCTCGRLKAAMSSLMGTCTVTMGASTPIASQPATSASAAFSLATSVFLASQLESATDACAGSRPRP